MSQTVAEVLIGVLEQTGVKQIFGLIGDSLNPLADALRRSNIEWIGVRHEEGAALAAAGQAKLTGQLAVCAGTTGPGSTHLVAGLYEASRDHAPVLVMRSMSRRWGSYNGLGRVLLNPDLIRAPTACIDYVITHELVHILHPNHGQKFYELLESLARYPGEVCDMRNSRHPPPPLSPKAVSSRARAKCAALKDQNAINRRSETGAR
jgi:glyoxylate carboligase